MTIEGFNYHSNYFIYWSLAPHDKKLLAYWFAQHFYVYAYCFIVKEKATDAIFIFCLSYRMDYFVAGNVAVFWRF